jgi:hypothetical protein
VVSNVFSPLGVSVDYIALRAPEYGFGEYGTLVSQNSGGVLNVLNDAQVEVGIDVTRDVFVVGSFRVRTTANATAAEAPRNPFGLRVEYRFFPTWTGEFYYEDRFARMPSFGLAEIDDRKIQGISIFREWGY